MRTADFSHSAFGSLNFLPTNFGWIWSRPTLILTLYFCLYVFSIVGGPEEAIPNSFVEYPQKLRSPCTITWRQPQRKARMVNSPSMIPNLRRIGRMGWWSLDVDVIGWHFFGSLGNPYRTAAWRMRFTRRVHWAGFVCQDPQLPSKQDPWLIYCRL